MTESDVAQKLLGDRLVLRALNSALEVTWERIK
jgi:hypothetical protein